MEGIKQPAQCELEVCEVCEENREAGEAAAEELREDHQRGNNREQMRTASEILQRSRRQRRRFRLRVPGSSSGIDHRHTVTARGVRADGSGGEIRHSFGGRERARGHRKPTGRTEHGKANKYQH